MSTNSTIPIPNIHFRCFVYFFSEPHLSSCLSFVSRPRSTLHGSVKCSISQPMRIHQPPHTSTPSHLCTCLTISTPPHEPSSTTVGVDRRPSGPQNGSFPLHPRSLLHCAFAMASPKTHCDCAAPSHSSNRPLWPRLPPAHASSHRCRRGIRRNHVCGEPDLAIGRPLGAPRGVLPYPLAPLPHHRHGHGSRCGLVHGAQHERGAEGAHAASRGREDPGGD